MTTADGTTAQVGELPDCDMHLRLFDAHVPAAYDAATTLPGGPWAYLCDECFRRHSPGRLGLGHGQRLVLANDAD